jgi:beta-glucuronidase
VPSAALWSPASPTLYDLTAEIVRNGTVLDRYLLPVGIRTVAVEGDQLLLNGEPIVLRGYGRHEDFAISGRGYNPAVIIKDYDLMRWTGANSFRTTHYPYSEQMLDLADRLGFLVIDETPAVEMYFNDAGRDERLATWKQMTEAMVRRDKNHPSVIMWSVANEPHSRRPEAKPAFKEVIDLVRKLDATRPVTFASYLGVNDQGAEWGDVICLNRYSGWYSESGQINEGVKALDAELDALYEKFKRPILVTEFGADTVAGVHHEPPVMFSEEYQSEMLAGYIEVMDRKPFVVGQHVWNLCDFRTYQSVRRIGALNMKGVFTRDRRPKLAAHTLRKLWRR